MLKHMKIHDPKKKPFFCKFCGNSFAHKKEFAKHAICQLTYYKKNTEGSTPAEIILDSVKSVFDKNNKALFEADEQLILSSVEEFSTENLSSQFSEQDGAL